MNRRHSAARTLAADISVVIPAYNAAGHIARAIESVLGQSALPGEIIVVDDGSVDDIADVVLRYHPRVQLVRRPNGGPGAARNTGIRACRGTWIALLDADDAWLTDKVAKQLPLLDDPATGLVHARVTIASGVAAPRLTTFDDLWEANRIIASSAMIRRTCLEAVGGFDEAVELIGVEDYNLWLRLAAQGCRIVNHPEWLVTYSPALGNLSSQTQRRVNAELANVAKFEEAAQVTPRMAEAKRRRLLSSYGGLAFYHRELETARWCYWHWLRRTGSPVAAAWWAISLLPRKVIDLKRLILRRQPYPE